ncbi:hypothetical protein K9U40_05050, partial [Xanthobacter autotrophicus]|uniref:DUF6969 family protein n=1 Tax=Xanthobacter autotrophicus TaxID=280 RepID=UPI0024AA19F7|nr:hypothetical protein [Xanthobacter autotrophicus]
PRRQNAGGGPYGLRQHRHGGVTHTRTKLSKAANLSAKPGPPHARPDAEDSGKQLCHLVAISMDHRGVPVELFTTNQWVTDEWLYPADAVIPLIDRFAFSDPGAAPLAARWLAAFIALHQPVIARLLQERDAALEIGTAGGAGRWGDPDLGVLSRRPVDIDGWITAVRGARQDR